MVHKGCVYIFAFLFNNNLQRSKENSCSFIVEKISLTEILREQNCSVDVFIREEAITLVYSSMKIQRRNIYIHYCNFFGACTT